MELKGYKESQFLSVFAKEENFQLICGLRYAMVSGKEERSVGTVDWLFMIRTLNVMYEVAVKVVIKQAFMENACRFLKCQHSLGTPLGGAAFDQHHLVHNNGSRHLTENYLSNQTCLKYI